MNRTNKADGESEQTIPHLESTELLTKITNTTHGERNGLSADGAVINGYQQAEDEVDSTSDNIQLIKMDHRPKT